MASMSSQEEISRLVRPEMGELDRRIFSDQSIFDLEMERIFHRAWLFLCHESQIPRRGDFFEAPMGRENVLVVRQRDKSIKALLNTCTHRGNAVCRAEEGNVRNFMCTYHGWTFGLDGQLVGVPGKEQFYGEDLAMDKHPLRQVAKLEMYKGFVFGTFDETAPPLEEFLGRTGRLGLDFLAARDVESVPGIQKYVINCNWKFTVDNVFDWYHPQITHMSALSTGMIPGSNLTEDNNGAKTADGKDLGIKWRPTDLDNIAVLGEYGHAIAGESRNAAAVAMYPGNEWRDRPEVIETLGPIGSNVAGHPNIFPTTWVTNGAQLCLRVPRSPNKTEIWWFSFREKNKTPEENAALLTRQIHVFGPAGVLEQEDGENWVQSTMQTRGEVSREVPQLLKMGIGRGKIIKEDGLARIEASTNEYAQMWTYVAWREWMLGRDWDELKANTTPRDQF